MLFCMWHRDAPFPQSCESLWLICQEEFASTSRALLGDLLQLALDGGAAIFLFGVSSKEPCVHVSIRQRLAAGCHHLRGLAGRARCEVPELKDGEPEARNTGIQYLPRGCHQ